MKRADILRTAACVLLLLLLAPYTCMAQEARGLSWLAVQNGVFSPVFTPQRNTYYAILENGIDSFEAAGVEMRPFDLNAKVTAVCLDALDERDKLPEGRRVTYLITVEEGDQDVSRYYLKLYRKAAYTAPIHTGLELANITINGGAVEVPNFSGIKAYYEVDVLPREKLHIQAYPADRSKMATVVNAPKIMPDEPVCVSILVSSGEGGAASVYTLVLRPQGFAVSERFTGFELLAAVIAAFVLGVAVSRLAGRRRRHA